MNQKPYNKILVSVIGFFGAIVFTAMPAFFVLAQSGTAPPAPAPVPPVATSTPTAATGSATSAPASSAQLKPVVAPKPKPAALQLVPTSTPASSTTAQPTSPAGGLLLPQAAGAPTPSGNPLDKTLALVAGGVAALAGAWAVVLKAKKKDKKKSNQDRCAKIKEALTAKQQELEGVNGGFSVKQALVDHLGEKLEDKKTELIEKHGEKVVSKILGEDLGGTVNELGGAVLGVKEAYDELQDKWEKAKELLEALKAKQKQLSGEVKTLEAAYNSCLLGTLSQEAAGALGFTLPLANGKTYIDKVAFIEIQNQKVLETKTLGKDKWYIPGGKREKRVIDGKQTDQWETDQEALCREIYEELNIHLIPETIKPYGVFEAQAHGKPQGTIVRMACYTAKYSGTLTSSSEVEKMDWFGYSKKGEVSPVDQLIFDDLKAKKLISS